MAWAVGPDPDSALCNSEGFHWEGITGSNSPPDSMEVLIIWVGFASHPDSTDLTYCKWRNLGDDLPSWYRDVETEFEQYFDWQSYGNQYIDFKTVQQPGADSLKAWSLGMTPCYWKAAATDPAIGDSLCPYARDGRESEGCINRRVVDLIANTLGTSTFDGVDAACFIHLASAFTREDVAGWGGEWGHAYNCSTCAFNGPGNTQRPVKGHASGDEVSTKWMLAHEFGHTMGLAHTPGTDRDSDDWVETGRYSPMQKGAPQPIDFVPAEFVPYHPWNLTEYPLVLHGEWDERGALGWVDSTRLEFIDENTLDISVPDIRSSGGKIVRVDTKIATYRSEFWIVHHQNNEFDDVYGVDGLAIWHIRDPEAAYEYPPTDLDLELATGKRETPCPGTVGNAATGLDSLECEVNKGASSDFFVAGDEFSDTTNPSTRDYSSGAYPGNQNTRTDVKVSDIRLPGLVQNPNYLIDVTYEGLTTSPYLYTWNGRHYPRFVNVLPVRREADPSANRSDCVFVGEQTPVHGRYLFKIREDGSSRTTVDRATLLVVDHSPNVSIGVENDGTVFGYYGRRPLGTVVLPEGSLGDVRFLGNAVHGAPGSQMELVWPIASANDALVFTHKGLAANDVLPSPAVAVERFENQSGWIEVAHLPRRSAYATECISLDELGHGSTGPLAIRLRWLDYHSVDLVSVVEPASEQEYMVRAIPPDTVEVAYEVVDDELLAVEDGEEAVLNPGQKLTFGARVPQVREGWRQVVAVALQGSYSIPAGQRGAPSGVGTPSISYLAPARPNPFNPTTTIRFGLGKGGNAELAIYDPTGRLVRRLYEGPLPAGEHHFDWDGRAKDGLAVGSGVYFYRLELLGESKSGKLIVMK